MANQTRKERDKTGIAEEGGCGGIEKETEQEDQLREVRKLDFRERTRPEDERKGNRGGRENKRIK